MTGSEHQSYLTPPIGRPTRESISEALRFRVPSNFAKFIGQIYDFGNGDPEVCNSALFETIGIFPCGQSAKYSSTPPELFPVGSTGCDGEHYGFVLHAPELDLDELPFGQICPMDYVGVSIIAATSEEGISQKAWDSLDCNRRMLQEKPVSDYLIEIDRIAQATVEYCEITPKQSVNRELSIPYGWKHLPSEDVIGTLAPRSWFASKTLVEFEGWTLQQFMKAATDETQRGYYAAALHYLREGFWENWRTGPAYLAKANVRSLLLDGSTSYRGGAGLDAAESLGEVFRRGLSVRTWRKRNAPGNSPFYRAFSGWPSLIFPSALFDVGEAMCLRSS